MYKEEFVTSWKDIKNYPILFLPTLMYIVFNLIFGLILLKYFGLLKVFTDPNLLMQELEVIAPAIKSFLQQNAIRVVIALAFFVLTNFVVGSGLKAMKFGMMKDVMRNRRPSVKKMFGYGRYTPQVIYMRFIMFLIGVVVFLFVSGSGIILSTLNPRSS